MRACVGACVRACVCEFSKGARIELHRNTVRTRLMLVLTNNVIHATVANGLAK